MLDLRLQLTRMRGEYLNQMNTQSTLLAGCAVAMLNSGELRSLDDGDDVLLLSVSWWWLKICNYAYTTSTVVCLAASLWTIYTAMNLITLSIHSTLNGESAAAITEADQLIESRMAEVRLVFVTALVALACGAISMIAAIADTVILLLCLLIFLFAFWHAFKSDDGTVRLYERFTGLSVEDRWRGASAGGYTQLRELLIPFGMVESTGRERLHDQAQPVVEVLLSAVTGARGRGAGVPSGGGAAAAQDGAFPATRHPREPAEVDPAAVIQRFWRRHRARRTRVRSGWLLKTASGAGPLERLRHREIAPRDTPPARGAPPPKLASVPTGPPPRFTRWFVLDEAAHTLAIYSSPDDHAGGREAKGGVHDLRTYALLKVLGEDGAVSLALLPRDPLKALAKPAPAVATSPGTASAAATPSDESKSWYLRGKDDRSTHEWSQWLRRAGAARNIPSGQSTWLPSFLAA